MTKTLSFPHFPLTPVFLLFVFLFSCKKEGVRENANSPDLISAAAKPGAGAPNAPKVVYLTLAIDDNAGNKIKSDNGNPYIHGVDGVSAYFDDKGNLQFHTYAALSRRNGNAVRSMKFDFTDPCTTCSITSAGTTPEAVMPGSFTMVTQINGGTPLQNLGTANTQTVSLGGGFASQVSSPTDWRINFRYNTRLNDGNLNFATVTRISSTQWTVTGEVAKPVAALVTASGTLTGYYYMPFKFVLTANN